MADTTEEVPYQIVIVINAKSAEDALARKAEGTTKSVNPIPQPKPEPVARPQPAVAQGIQGSGQFSRTTTRPVNG